MWTKNDMFSDMCLICFILTLGGLFIHPLIGVILGVVFLLLWMECPNWFMRLIGFVFRSKIKANFKEQENN